MKKLLPLLSFALILTACNGADGVSKETSRIPRGNANAAVTVTEFADLQCPACRAAHSQVSAPLLEKYGQQIRFEFKHFPLRSIHRFAMDAAEAAECAADQGKFWEYVDKVYEEQPDLDHDALLAWSDELGLDSELLEKCWKSHAKRDTILADYKEGRDLGVGGTPTFFVNGERVATGFDTLGAAIESAIGGFQQRL